MSQEDNLFRVIMKGHAQRRGKKIAIDYAGHSAWVKRKKVAKKIRTLRKRIRPTAQTKQALQARNTKVRRMAGGRM